MNRKGFTLIEIMIVFAIIGILACVAVPKFRQLVEEKNGTYIAPTFSITLYDNGVVVKEYKGASEPVSYTNYIQFEWNGQRIQVSQSMKYVVVPEKGGATTVTEPIKSTVKIR